jgi:YrbI family 3-deoxy-D-manno-octulosonate 8-phosphate phosphatase
MVASRREGTFGVHMYLTKTIELIVYDFDGVMTDNTALLSEDGKESAVVNRGDGLGVKMIKDALGIKQVIISSEANPIVAFRGNKLGVDVLYNVKDKKAAMEKYCADNEISLKNALYIGNDINDYDAMQASGFRACPSDAEEEIIAISGMIFNAKGGRGVVRELYRALSKISIDEVS